MNHPNDEQDPVWDLLKQARPNKVPSRFAEGVVREVRRLEDETNHAWGGLSLLRAGGALAAAAALLLGGFFLLRGTDSQPPSATGQPAPIAVSTVHQEEISIEEFEAELDELVYMSELMGVSDTTLLPDEDLAALLF